MSCSISITATTVTYNDPRRFGFMDLAGADALDRHPRLADWATSRWRLSSTGRGWRRCSPGRGRR